MKLLILLLCLGLERYFRIGALLKRFHWFDYYSSFLLPISSKLAARNACLGFSVLLLPLVIAVSVFYFLFADLAFGLFGMLFSLLILLYCLGPDDLYHQLKGYFSAAEKGDDDEVRRHYLDVVGYEASGTESDVARSLTEAIIVQSNERFFAVIFWYIICGPIGSLIYRVTTLLNQRAHAYPDAMLESSSKGKTLQAILDWIPVRLTALLYIVVGDFHASFPKWWHGVASGLSESRQWLLDCSLAALLNDPQQESSIQENTLALTMLDNALIVVLVLIAVFTLGAWIY